MICPLADLGKVAAVQGDHGRAASLCVQALTLARDMGEVYEIVLVLQSLAAIASATGWAQWAGRLWGAAGALRTTHGIWLSPASEEEYDRLLAPARIQLGDAQWQDACEEGKSMPFERVVEEVLHRDGPFTRDPVAGVGYKPDDHRL
jgi:hypothetical protein